MRLDGRRYSPAVTERIVVVGGSATSFTMGSKMLSLLMDLKVSAKTINETTAKIGDEQAGHYGARPLTTPATQAELPISLACVEIDGGRMQTRTPGEGAGVHDPHWRENKNGGFFSDDW